MSTKFKSSLDSRGNTPTHCFLFRVRFAHGKPNTNGEVRVRALVTGKSGLVSQTIEVSRIGRSDISVMQTGIRNWMNQFAKNALWSPDQWTGEWISNEYVVLVPIEYLRASPREIKENHDRQVEKYIDNKVKEIERKGNYPLTTRDKQ